MIWCRLSPYRPSAPVYEMDTEKDRFSRRKVFSNRSAVLARNKHRNDPYSDDPSAVLA